MRSADQSRTGIGASQMLRYQRPLPAPHLHVCSERHILSSDLHNTRATLSTAQLFQSKSSPGNTLHEVARLALRPSSYMRTTLENVTNPTRQSSLRDWSALRTDPRMFCVHDHDTSSRGEPPRDGRESRLDRVCTRPGRNDTAEQQKQWKQNAGSKRA